MGVTFYDMNARFAEPFFFSLPIHRLPLLPETFILPLEHSSTATPARGSDPKVGPREAAIVSMGSSWRRGWGWNSELLHLPSLGPLL